MRHCFLKLCFTVVYNRNHYFENKISFKTRSIYLISGFMVCGQLGNCFIILHLKSILAVTPGFCTLFVFVGSRLVEKRRYKEEARDSHGEIKALKRRKQA